RRWTAAVVLVAEKIRHGRRVLVAALQKHHERAARANRRPRVAAEHVAPERVRRLRRLRQLGRARGEGGKAERYARRGLRIELEKRGARSHRSKRHDRRS